MADARIGVQQSGTPDRQLDCDSLTVSAQTVYRERHVIADPTLDVGLAKVQNGAPGASDYGLTTRVVGMPAAAALADGTANPTLTEIQSFLQAWNGATWDRYRGRPLGHMFYRATSVALVSSGTSATTVSLGYLWHPSGIAALAYRLWSLKVVWFPGDDSAAVAAADPPLLKLGRITAENGTPGGTAQTIQALNNGSAASGATFRTGAAIPTRGTPIEAPPISLSLYGQVDLVAAMSDLGGNGPEMQKSVAEGWEVFLAMGTAPTAAAKFSVSALWSEFS